MALPYGLTTGLTAEVTDQNQNRWGARCLAHAIVYQYNGKAVKTDEVPTEVKERLIGTMLVGVKQEEPAPEEETPIETLNAIDSLIAEGEAQPTPDDVAAVAAMQPSSPVEPSPFNPTEPKPNEDWQPSTLEQGDDLGFSEDDAPTIDLAAELEEALARSIDRVNLRVLAKVLYERFGVYTAYLNRPPAQADIHPITGAVMNNFNRGQAYQQFKDAQRTGASWSPAVIKSQIAIARQQRGGGAQLPVSAMQTNQTVEPERFEGAPLESPVQQDRPRVNRHYESPHQSAVRSERGSERDGLDPDEVYAEPPINARTAIVRPFYNNRRSQAQLEEISRTRVPKQKQNVSFDDII